MAKKAEETVPWQDLATVIAIAFTSLILWKPLSFLFAGGLGMLVLSLYKKQPLFRSILLATCTVIVIQLIFRNIFTIALENVFSPYIQLAMLIGSVIDVVVGALPGASATMALAVMIPITFWFDSDLSLLLLTSVYCSGIFGGSISAVLLNIPGTPTSAATCFDGHPLTQSGQGGKAILTALLAATFGGIISGIALLFCAPALAALTLKFGAPETMMAALFGLTMVASLSSENLVKGLLMGVLGMFIGCISVSPSGVSQFTFGSIDLYAGL